MCVRRVALLAVILVVSTLPAALLCAVIVDLPDPFRLAEAIPKPSTLILDRNGVVLYEALPEGSGRRVPVALTDIPVYLRLATMATEDADFYKHHGLDLRAIARAVYYNVRYRRVVSGGSTITQQLARNLLLREERTDRTLRRKIREGLLALLIESRYSKDEILELYLNSTFYGRQSFGVAAAAYSYFGKPVSSLDLAECAFVAGLAQAPAVYDPDNGDAWRARQRAVLGLMERHGFVSAEAAEEAAREPLDFVPRVHQIRAPHFVMYVREQINSLFGAGAFESYGLQVHTTLDVNAQERVQDLIHEHLEALNRKTAVRVENAALVALDVSSGAILLMIGSPNYFDDSISGSVNAALALRQPGSAIKPITYAAAFERGYTPATVMADEQTTFFTSEGEAYVPLNFDRTFHGLVSLREALASSYNVVAVKVLDQIGLPAMLNMAARLGITTLDSEELGLATTLGGGEVSLLELTGAYGVFARGGLVLSPYAIEKVCDSTGRVLWQATPPRALRVLSPAVAFLITDVLSDDKARIPTFGESSVLSLSRPAAVKTGTTTDYRDNWTVGYTPQIVVGVWVGNADGTSMGHVSGVEGAAPIWHDAMELLHRLLPVRTFEEPAGMVRVEVCALTGLLPGPWCERRRSELFLAGTEPTRVCDVHRERAGTEEAWDNARALASWQRVGGETRQDVRIVQPVMGAKYVLAEDLPRQQQSIPFEVSVADQELPCQVRLFVDGALMAEIEEPPYRIMWTLAAGEHRLRAEAACEGSDTWVTDEVSVYVYQAE